MGHKGVSKRKPKGSKPFSKGKDGKSSAGQAAPVQGLIKSQDASAGNGNTNSYIWGNKKNKKGK